MKVKIRNFATNRVNTGLENLITLLEQSFNHDSCVEYAFRTNAHGYSILKFAGKTIPAHRFSYYWFNCLQVNPEKCVMHSCDNPKCINPHHLSEGSWSDNNKDRAKKGRTICLSFYRRKLSEQDVSYIKEKMKNRVRGTLAELAKEFNVDPNVIYNAVEGRYDNWEPPAKSLNASK